MGISKLSRNVLKTQARKIYKRKVKDIPKKDRLPFGSFFKQFLEIVSSQKTSNLKNEEIEVVEDFNFEDLVNVNEVSDDNLENKQ